MLTICQKRILQNEPQSIPQLLTKAQQLTNKNLLCLAKALNVRLPNNLKYAKGLVGTLIENFLGARSSSLPELDFPHLGVELKTIPVDQNYKPLESTHVCTLAINHLEDCWDKSWVRKKLSCVLWVPIKYHAELSQRVILKPFLWRPTSEDLMKLKQDWEEIMEVITTDIEKLTARFGSYLQIRPKAMNNKARIKTTSAFGSTYSVPKGFYLRTKFTQKILNDHYK